MQARLSCNSLSSVKNEYKQKEKLSLSPQLIRLSVLPTATKRAVTCAKERLSRADDRCLSGHSARVSYTPEAQITRVTIFNFGFGFNFTFRFCFWFLIFCCFDFLKFSVIVFFFGFVFNFCFRFCF